MFDVTRNKGVHITFENGWTVSLQWGAGNYAANRDLSITDTDGKEVPPSATAECAAWHETLGWHCFLEDQDQVKGHMTPSEVLAFMNEVATKEKS